VVGGLLARADGEATRVAEAISRLYEPASPDGPLPDEQLAQVLGLADRLDTLAGCFAVA